MSESLVILELGCEACEDMEKQGTDCCTNGSFCLLTSPQVAVGEVNILAHFAVGSCSMIKSDYILNIF